jgi:hypothetical protein
MTAGLLGARQAALKDATKADSRATSRVVPLAEQRGAPKVDKKGGWMAD